MARWLCFSAILCLNLHCCCLGDQPTVEAVTWDEALGVQEDIVEDDSDLETYFTMRNRLCRDLTCPEAQNCELNAQLEPFCSCDLICNVEYDPVCGTNGKTYSNMCQLTVASCNSKQDVNLIYHGKCGSLKSTGWYLLMKIALPTGIVASVVFLCQLACWCKKGREYQYRCCPPRTRLPSYEEDQRRYHHNSSVVEPVIPSMVTLPSVPSDRRYMDSNEVRDALNVHQQHTSLLDYDTHQNEPRVMFTAPNNGQDTLLPYLGAPHSNELPPPPLLDNPRYDTPPPSYAEATASVS